MSEDRKVKLTLNTGYKRVDSEQSSIAGTCMKNGSPDKGWLSTVCTHFETCCFGKK